MYTREEALIASKEYFNDDLAADVFVSKYAMRNSEGKYFEKDPNDTFKRLAKEFARIESRYTNPLSYEEIFDSLDEFRYIVAQGSPLSAIGNTEQVQSISNCFTVDSPLDSYGGILLTDQEIAQIAKRRGGVGTDISEIRPKGMPTKNAAKTTDGIAVFMERFSNTCREVAQNGRRGALMLTISVEHPEIETFINIKKDLTKVTGANISIRITDEFMRAVISDSEFTLRWPVGSSKPKYTKVVKALEIWNQIIDAAWTCAEPGVLFWDTVLRNGPADIYKEFRSISTNPCSEITLSAYDSCRLMLLNLFSFVVNPYTESAYFNYKKLTKYAKIAQRLMDDLVDLEIEAIDKIILKIKKDPEPDSVKKVELDLWEKIKSATENGRRTGLGISSLGDTLAALGIKYGSEKSIETTFEIYRTLAQAAHGESIQLAKERGAFYAFNYDLEKDHKYLNRVIPQESKEDWKKYGRRNISLTTTAPVGSLSLLMKKTSGIEPVFMISSKRRRKIASESERVDFIDALGDKWTEYDVFHEGVKLWQEKNPEKSINESPYVGSTAMDIDWKNSCQIQAAAQQWVDHAISKTCNLPATATRELISEIYRNAWITGCKGFTVYRDGCRTGVLVNTEIKKENKAKFEQNDAIKRPNNLQCDINHVSVKGEKWVVLIGKIDDKPYEIFGGKADKIQFPSRYKLGSIEKDSGKSKYNLVIDDDGENFVVKDIISTFDNPQYALHTRLLSLSMRHGAPIKYIVDQLQKDTESSIFDFSKVIARVLKKYISDGVSSQKCIQCDSKLTFQEGCLSCKNCGMSKC